MAAILGAAAGYTPGTMIDPRSTALCVDAAARLLANAESWVRTK
jgi:hypothetical protein